MASKKQQRARGTRRENRHERRQKQHSGGGEWDCVRLPAGVEVFKPEKGETYHIDVIPYIVGAHNKNADPGDEYFELSYPIYRDLGIDEKKFIAIRELCNVPDPVAEHFAALRKQDADWEDMKQFKPTWRQMMLVFVHEQADKGLQLFEGAYGTFGELLDEEIKANEEDYIDNFDDPEGGATLEVRFKAKNIGQQNPWVLASKITFAEREGGFDADGDPDLAEKVLAQAAAICLDDCLKIPTYEQLKAALEGQPEGTNDGDDEDDAPAPKPKGKGKGKPAPVDEEEEDEEEDEPAPKPKGKGKPAPAPKPKGKPAPVDEEEEDEEEEDAIPMFHKGDTVEHDEHGTSTIIRVASDGKTCTLKDEDGEIQKGVPVAELTAAAAVDEEEEEEEEEEPAPKPKGKGKPAPAAAPAKGTGKGTKAAPAPAKGKGGKAAGGDDDWDDDWDD